jgi:hypothetical protein
MRGASIPLLVALTSSIAELCAGVPPLLMATPCAFSSFAAIVIAMMQIGCSSFMYGSFYQATLATLLSFIVHQYTNCRFEFMNGNL